MENSKKRWSVTYTKHIKQKRKVYQDGFLDLHISTHKAMLFDDCDKLLECKILKGEVVSSGETLTFNGYLVDVGDPESDVKVKVEQNPISDLNMKGISKKIFETPRSTLMHRHKFRSPISSDNNDAAEKSKTRKNNLSPSRKIIREFKRSELQRYGVSKSRPNTMNTGVNEWQVLYTTQLTQKAKKYHDGFLRLSNGGNLGRQIMLYDASGNLLESRFLKKDEIIRPHESVTFDAHLVDIGEPEGENQVSADLNVGGNTINVVGKEGIMHENQNGLETNNCLAKEWHASYTSQITQKAKKFSNGIIRISSCGSYRMKVTLLNEDKIILSSKFLSFSEDLRSGSTFALPKYLVEVGEPYSPKETLSNDCLEKDAVSNFNISSTGKFQNVACSGADKSKICTTASQNKPVRDVHQILSILQKPIVHSDKNMKENVSIEELQISDAEVVHPKGCQLPRVSLQNDGRSDNKDNEGSNKGMSNLSGVPLSSGNESKTSNQSHLYNTKVDTKCRNEAFTSGFSSIASASAPYGPTDDIKNSSEPLKSAKGTDEWPSFDLGF